MNSWIYSTGEAKEDRGMEWNGAMEGISASRSLTGTLRRVLKFGTIDGPCMQCRQSIQVRSFNNCMCRWMEGWRYTEKDGRRAVTLRQNRTGQAQATETDCPGRGMNEEDMQKKHSHRLFGSLGCILERGQDDEVRESVVIERLLIHCLHGWHHDELCQGGREGGRRLKHALSTCRLLHSFIHTNIEMHPRPPTGKAARHTHTTHTPTHTLTRA